MGNTASARFLPQKPVFETGSRSGIWDVSWQVSDSFKLENKLVYARYDNDRIHLPMSVHPQGVPATLRGHEVQWEPVLHYRPEGGSVKGLAGLYFCMAVSLRFGKGFRRPLLQQRPSEKIYSMMKSGSPYSTGVPFSTRISLTTPDFSASISFISFMASH